MSTRLASDPPLAGLRVSITLHKANNLLAKDRNIFGKRTSSDPYVKVFYKGEAIGKTPVKKKTLSPEWNHTVKHTVGANEGETIRNATTSNSLNMPGHPSFLLVLFDHDNGTSDDVLGQVTVPIPYSGIEKQWLTLETGASNEKHYCKKTKGEVQVSIEIKNYLLPDIVRGNVVPIKMPSKSSILKVGLGWEVARNQSSVDLDVSCVAIGKKGQVMMHETVYFSNLRNPNGSIVHSGDEREGKRGLGDGSDDREQITMNLSKLPESVCAYVLLVTVATPRVDFSQVTSARVRISDGVSGIGLCAFRPAYEGANTALFLLRIARNKQNGVFGKGSWSVATIGDADASARDFGSLIPEIRGYCRDLVPNLEIDPNERIAVMNKGVTVCVTDYSPERNVLPEVLAMGLAWDVTDGVNIDLDASVACLDARMNLVDLVYFKNLHSADGSIHHSGDEREGDAIGDDEKIILALNAVNPMVEHIVFVINSYSEQELDDIAMASCHLFDPQTRKDLATYTLTNNSALDKHTALILADLYRDAQSRKWMLRILSIPSHGKTARRCLGAIADYLRRVPPQPASIPPNPTVISNEMPVAVPVDQHVTFVPDEDITVQAIYN
mmetsp:Transcript_22914/g.48122  ORF Transcript_22914/g.48122 Transcript_22914/m.48122 type:complete len:611 (+) Transcript_22914:74-1906(+)